MISPTGRFEEFAEAAYGKSFVDILFLAEQEAMDAERVFYRSRKRVTGESDRIENPEAYSETLKAFVGYLRYGFCPSHIENAHCQLFERVFSGMPEDPRFHPTHFSGDVH